ncbi:MAG: carbon-nitrogen hydrolase family protein [Alphaproteobacteria bacterium]
MADMRIAAAQFDISGSISSNIAWIEKLARRAAEHKARLVVFPEAAITGYAPMHLPSPDQVNWAFLEEAKTQLCALAADLGLWLVIGSMSKPQQDQAPRLTAVVIDDKGNITCEYDKRRLAPSEQGLYSAGQDRMTIQVDGMICGLMICHEHRFTEDFQAYKDDGAQVILQPIYFANEKGTTPSGEMLEPRLRTRADDKDLWIVVSNSTGRHCPMPASIIRPDGSLKQAQRHRSGLIIDDVG